MKLEERNIKIENESGSVEVILDDPVIIGNLIEALTRCVPITKISIMSPMYNKHKLIEKTNLPPLPPGYVLVGDPVDIQKPD